MKAHSVVRDNRMKRLGRRWWNCAVGRSPPDWALESGRFLGQSGLRIRFSGKGPVTIDPERTSSSERTRCRRSVQRVPSPMPTQGAPMTDREKILIALREKPLKAFEIMKRVNIKHQDDCQSLLLKMRDDGAVKFDIHKGHWLAA